VAETKTPEELLIEATVRREVQKQLANLNYGKFGESSPARMTADEYDFAAHPCNMHPGKDWFLVECFGMGGNIYILWACSRLTQAQNRQAAVMPLPVAGKV
jgi:hypothetical protein